MKKMIKILSLLVGVAILTGCSDHATHMKEPIQFEHTREAFQLFYLNNHFKTNADVIYNEPLLLLNANHKFQFDISTEVYERFRENPSPLFSVYVDSQLTRKELIWPYLRNNSIRINLPSTATWSFSNYYLVQYFDLITGDKLEKPLVTVFTIDRPLNTPVLSVVHEEDGSFTLSWTEVENAERYHLMRIDFEGRGSATGALIDTTTETTWNSKRDGQDNVDALFFANHITNKDQQFVENNFFWWEAEGALITGSTWGVIAIDGNESSSLSFFREDLIDEEMLICQAAPFAMSEVMPSLELASIEQIPAYLPATACSGNTVNAQVILDIEGVFWQDDILHVPYAFHNTTFHDYFVISGITSADYLERLATRQGEIEVAFSQKEHHDYRYESTTVVAFDVERSHTLPEIQDTIFSTSELETFLVANMIEGAGIIDISDFSLDLNDQAEMFELMNQIRYQNPLVLDFRGFHHDPVNERIFVHYLYDPETRAAKQQTIRDEVSRIVSEIITPDMSDVEKVYAINQFIIDHTVYDEDAYEWIRSGAPRGEAERFTHANTPAGVFIHGLAVCGGYATAFMLLADYVGIESIQVTGYTVDNPERHAWNRVLIGDQWYVVDPTHNDAEPTFNTVLLLADDLADQIYIEDQFFLIPNKLGSHRAPKPSIHEYYVAQDLSASSVSEGINLLIGQLQNQSSATIRVPFDTTDEQFGQIGQAVTDHFGRGTWIYWLNGVLHIRFE